MKWWVLLEPRQVCLNWAGLWLWWFGGLMDPPNTGLAMDHSSNPISCPPLVFSRGRGPKNRFNVSLIWKSYVLFPLSWDKIRTLSRVSLGPHWQICGKTAPMVIKHPPAMEMFFRKWSICLKSLNPGSSKRMKAGCLRKLLGCTPSQKRENHMRALLEQFRELGFTYTPTQLWWSGLTNIHKSPVLIAATAWSEWRKWT